MGVKIGSRTSLANLGSYSPQLYATYPLIMSMLKPQRLDALTHSLWIEASLCIICYPLSVVSWCMPLTEVPALCLPPLSINLFT